MPTVYTSDEYARQLEASLSPVELSYVDNLAKEFAPYDFHGAEHTKARRFIIRKLMTIGIQNVHTPYTLCNKMIGKLGEYTNLTDKKIAVLFNLEFVEVLIYDFNIKPENIYFFADDPTELVTAAGLYGLREGVNLFLLDVVSNDTGNLITSVGEMKFSLVLQNPPYQAPQSVGLSGKRGGGHTLWDKMVLLSLKICDTGGYLCMVHPAGWRGLEAFRKIGELIKSKKVEYLEVHDKVDGASVFGSGTRYDWYVLQNSPSIGNKTVIRSLHGELFKHDLSAYPVVPNGDHPLLPKLFSGSKLTIIQDSAYHSQRDFMQNKKSSLYKYPCVNHVNSKNEPSFWYSSKNNAGHFGIPKVIFARMQSGVFVDKEGKYALTQDARGIVAPVEILDKIALAMLSAEFRKISQLLAIGSKDTFEVHAIKHLNKDFWKFFVPGEVDYIDLEIRQLDEISLEQAHSLRGINAAILT